MNPRRIEINNLIQGDEKSFKQLFKDNYSGLYYFAKKFISNDQEAEDLIQEAFINLYQNRANIHSVESAKGFLFTSIKNDCLNIIRHSKVEEKYKTHIKEKIAKLERDYFSNSDDLNAFVNEKVVYEQIQKAVELLPPQCRIIFKLSRFSNLSNKEIAEQLGISVKTVENQITIALKKLFEQLKDYLPALIILFIR